MRTIVIDGNASRIEIKDGRVLLHYEDEPKLVPQIVGHLFEVAKRNEQAKNV